MSHYLQRLVERADAGPPPASAVKPAGPLESGPAPAIDPFETIGEPVAGIAPAVRDEISAGPKLGQQEPGPQVSFTESPRVSFPRPPLDTPAEIAPVASRAEPALPRIAPHSDAHEDIPASRTVSITPPAAPLLSQTEERRAVTSEARELAPDTPRIEPERDIPQLLAPLSTRTLPAREESGETTEPEAPRETREPDLQQIAPGRLQPRTSEPARLDAPPMLEERDRIPEPEPGPRLEIGHLSVEVVPAQPSVREVVRVVSRVPAGRAHPGVSSKLRFGLGQM